LDYLFQVYQNAGENCIVDVKSVEQSEVDESLVSTHFKMKKD